MATAKTKAATSGKGRIMEYKDFNLTKFKVTKEGVNVTHYENGANGGETTKNGIALQHPDLDEALNRLQIYMADRIGLLQGWDFARQACKNNAGDLAEAMQRHKETIKTCSVSGLSFSGLEESYGVIITGSIKLPKGGTMGVAVPKIKFAASDLGYEDEVEELCEDVKQEIYKYRFQNKHAQLDIVTEIDNLEQQQLLDMEVDAEVITATDQKN